VQATAAVAADELDLAVIRRNQLKDYDVEPIPHVDAGQRRTLLRL
jgi:hypothetical protein